LSRVDLLERGELRSVLARAVVAALPGEIAVRELESVEKVLGWPEETRRIEQLPERFGPGNILMLEAAFEHASELVSGFGKLGVPAQAVGEQAAKRMAGYLASSAVAGPYLADQLLLPMALAGGGSFTTVNRRSTAGRGGGDREVPRCADRLPGEGQWLPSGDGGDLNRFLVWPEMSVHDPKRPSFSRSLALSVQNQDDRP
jgi:hypothetical protein